MSDRQLSRPQQNLLQTAYQNGGGVNVYGNPSTALALHRRGLISEHSGGMTLGVPYRRFFITPEGVREVLNISESTAR